MNEIVEGVYIYVSDVWPIVSRSSNHDPGTPARESLSATEHAAILQEKKLLDIPKLMDISALYGHDNPDLTQRLVIILLCCKTLFD
jgi:hypothetical protein